MECSEFISTIRGKYFFASSIDIHQRIDYLKNEVRNSYQPYDIVGADDRNVLEIRLLMSILTERQSSAFIHYN